MATRLARRKKITTSFVPNETKHEFIETIQWGKERKNVYRERRPTAEISEVVPDLDEESGGKRWKEDHHGRRTNRFHTKRVWLYPADPDNPGGGPDLKDPRNFREFIVADLGNGNDRKVFNFRPDPERVAAREAEKARKAKLDKLLDAMSRTDAEPEDLVAALTTQAEPPKRRGRPPKEKGDGD